MAAAAASVWGFQGSRVPFIGAEHGPWRAGPKGTRRRARGDLGRLQAGVRLGPERKTVPTGGTRLAVKQGGGRGAGPEREKGRRGGKAGTPVGPEQKGNGPQRKRRKQEKEKVGRAEKGLGERKKFSIFQNDSNTFNLNSNSKI